MHNPTIYIFGDTHGLEDIEKIFLPLESYTKDDFIMVCGDFGVLWGDRADDCEKFIDFTITNLACNPFNLNIYHCVSLGLCAIIIILSWLWQKAQNLCKLLIINFFRFYTDKHLIYNSFFFVF